MLLYARSNTPTEFSLATSRAYADPFNEIALDVIFTGPGGEWRVPAFWAGAGVFRVRFAAPEPGRYSWRSECSNPEDAGLHGCTGELEVSPYDGGNELYTHGRLRAAENRRTLEHADGKPFLWTGDTWWMGLTKRLDWPNGYRMLTADRVAKGFSLVQIVAGPLPDFDPETAAFHPQQANEAGWSWEQDWSRINPAFYDLADLKIVHLVESGIAPCIVGMWGFYIPILGVEKAKRHWRNLIARYGAYPVIWCVAGEVNLPTYSHLSRPNVWETEGGAQREMWTEVARCIHDIDPYHNPVGAHPSGGKTSRDGTVDESLLDLDMLQTGHSGYASLRPSVDQVNEANAQQLRMPVVNSEVCYEGIMGASWQDIQRFLFWTSMLSGSAGHTYGAQGMWAMSSRDEPFNGSTASWGDGYWQDAMHYPGSAHVGLGRKILERYPWWQMEPKQEPEADKAGRVSPFTAHIPGKLTIYYLPSTCMEPPLAGMQGLRAKVEPGRATFINPRTGDDIDAGPVTPDSDGLWAIPQKPTMEDWVLVVER